MKAREFLAGVRDFGIVLVCVIAVVSAVSIAWVTHLERQREAAALKPPVHIQQVVPIPPPKPPLPGKINNC